MLPVLEGPEIVLGLCSPIGTDNDKITALVVKHLHIYGYSTSTLKLTELMRSIVLKGQPLIESPVEKRYDTYIRYANRLREIYDSDDALVMLSCLAIRNEREKLRNGGKGHQPNHAYILDQLKRKEEADTLRQVYGRLFILISIYSEKEARVRRLANRIREDYSIAKPTLEHETAARLLIARDEEEQGEPHGQRLREVFPLADLFVNIDDLQQAERVIDRFFRSFFGANNVSPMKDEYGMYIAKAASLRSLDLSRQVGAAIFSDKGEVIALGCNEVPKPEGGSYWAEDSDDQRDYAIGGDENEKIKRALLLDVARRLREGGFIDEEKEREIVPYITSEATKKGSLLREALVMDLLEFGRVIHAEMSAISDAARLGRPIAGATLYCTTFPCHICAKHIVAAGLKRVVFIEPYPKSYAEHLLNSIVVKAGDSENKKVQFSPFIGASPRRFLELYERGRRKDHKGNFIEWINNKPRPIVKYTVPTYLENERAVAKLFVDKTLRLIDAGLVELRKTRTGAGGNRLRVRQRKTRRPQ